jgi:hypothetical protein
LHPDVEAQLVLEWHAGALLLDLADVLDSAALCCDLCASEGAVKVADLAFCADAEWQMPTTKRKSDGMMRAFIIDQSEDLRLPAIVTHRLRVRLLSAPKEAGVGDSTGHLKDCR